MQPIPLPTWTDAASVAAFLTSLFGFALFILGIADPTIVPAVTGDAQLILPTLGGVIASVAQIVNVIWHRKVQAAAFEAYATIKAAGK